MATHTEKLFGDALQGGRVPDRASLQKIADDLLSFAQIEKGDRNQNPLQDAVVVEKDCPAGLIGCDAAELSKKTGGLLNCPPLSVAPDPLIVDYKGRLCYAPEDIRREFEGKELNVDSLIDKYSRKLLKYLESGSNLRVAVDVAQRGPKGNPLVLNAYRNSANLVAALTTLYGNVPTADQLAEVAALLSKFTDKLVPSSGAELVNYIMNAPGNPLNQAGFGGAGIHQRLTFLIVVGVIATSNDNGKSSRLAKLLNTLGEVLVFGEAGYVGGNDAATAALNAVSFLPLSFRQGLGINGAATSTNGAVLLYRFVVFSLVVSIGEILDSAIPELYCSSITGLRIAFNEMRVKRDAVEQYMKRKVDGASGSTAEEIKLLEAKKGGDRLYVARIVFFAKVCLARLGYKFAEGFPALLATDPQNYYEQALLALNKPLPAAGTARAGMQALVAFSIGVLQAAGFNLISLPGAYRAFFAQAFTYSKSTAFSIPEDPEIFPQQLASSSPTDKAGLTAALAADSLVLGPGAGPVCKSYVDGVPVFLGVSINPAGAASAADVGTKQALAKLAYNAGSAPDVASILNSLTAAEVRGILVRNCFPITEPADANARLHYTLSRGKPTDDVFAAAFGAAVDAENFKARGLLAANRDLYVKFLIVMAWVGNAQVTAQFLYGQNIGTFAATLVGFVGEKKVPTGTRLGGGDDEIDGGEIDIDSAADFFLSGGQVIVPAHQMPDGLAKYLDKYDVDRREGKEIRELQEKLEKRGFGISFIPTGSKCPSYARDSGNTFGAPGHKNWVETKSAWPKCMELMGVQFVTDKGYCYPYGMSCYKEDDVITTTEKTEGKVANWNVLAEIVQEVQQKRYEEWLQGELDRINKDAINSGMSEEQKKELAMSFLPAEFKDMPDKASMLSLSVISSELSASVNEFTNSNDPAQLARLREILRNGYLQDEWYDTNVSVRNQGIDDKAKELLEQVKVCTDAAQIPGAAKPADCDERTFPDPHDPSKQIKVFIPKQINKEINEESIKRGEDPASIVKWWQEYYANRVVEKQKKQMEVAEKISPFKLPANLVYKAQDIEASRQKQLSEQGKFENLLDAALHKKGEKGYDIVSRYAK